MIIINIIKDFIAFIKKNITRRELIVFCSLVAFSLAHYKIVDLLK